jgi:hypothetical protein
MQNQGTQLQAVQIAGAASGMTLLGFQFAGATLGGSALDNLRIEHGELVAEQGGATRRGTALAGTRLIAQARNLALGQTAAIEYRLAAVEAETEYDPTATGDTFLYTLEQNVDGTGSWQPACAIDGDGRRAAIPLAAYWEEHGDRVESTTLFTLGCTTGVIAKCYRWGYRPWLTGFGDQAAMHWVCTRAARADYCGNGKSHTRDGTLINVWDNSPAPGPIQAHGTPAPDMLFEAGWSTTGAVCFSHARWLLGGPLIALGCPGRLLAPGLGVSGATVCDSSAEVIGQAGNARMFDESFLNLNLDLF